MIRPSDPAYSLKLFFGVIAIATTCSFGGQEVAIIPRPVSMQQRSGSFTLNNKTAIIIRHQTANLEMVGNELAEKLRRATGYSLDVRPDHRSVNTENAIVLTNEVQGGNLGDEGYELTVSEHTILIASPTAHGAFYGVQTLYQLMPPEVEGGSASDRPVWAIPCVEILDKPRFAWRGMHLDVGRHFFPAEFVKKYIDIMAAYKFNTFHWHLTEDQGWRIEIKKYPLLTGVGSMRRETMGDCTPYGGYYTQDEIRDVVEYARKRFVNIVPEIEMPGHAQAALSAYPEFSCSGGPLKVATEWGVFNDVYCAGREETFAFIRNILEEVTGLFPGPYVHIGGDECPKLRWTNCARCQSRIKAEGLKNESELQSYFIKRIEKILSAKGKRLVGWDEILEGGIAPEATVMSWRGIQGGIEAAKTGHDVVMSPGDHCYFDHYQGKLGEPAAIGGFLPIDTVYSYEPVPSVLSPAEARHILGAQGNMWTEWMPTTQHVEYMLLPRMLALSEVVWSPAADRSYPDFSIRLEKHYDRLAAMDVNFRVPPPVGAGGRAVIFHDTLVMLKSPVSSGKVYYSVGRGDTIPSLPYTRPITIHDDQMLFARTELANGRKSNVITTEFMLADPARNGLDYGYYEGKWDSLPDFPNLTPIRTGKTYDVSLDGIPHREDEFGVRLSGYVSIETEGEYRWYLNSDDGSELFVDKKELINNNGLHGPKEVSASVHLSRGKHPIIILYFERDGDQSLDLSMEGPGVPKRHVPPMILSP
jgi:hexosaminidase